MPHIPEYTNHIDNYNFIEHIVSIKCIQCGEFFEPDKTKDIVEPVCVECKNKPEIPLQPEPKKSCYIRKTPKLTPEQRKERKRKYQREYMRKYYENIKLKPITTIYRSKFKK